MQAAPDVAAAQPPMVTPPTLARATVPEFAKGDPLDLSPARGAPQQSYKRPKSIGPGPNRAPTAVPKPVEEFVPAAEGESEIPAASAGETRRRARSRCQAGAARQRTGQSARAVFRSRYRRRLPRRRGLRPARPSRCRWHRCRRPRMRPRNCCRLLKRPRPPLCPTCRLSPKRASSRPGPLPRSNPTTSPAARRQEPRLPPRRLPSLEAPARIAPSMLLPESAPAADTPAAAALPAMEPATAAPWFRQPKTARRRHSQLPKVCNNRLFPPRSRPQHPWRQRRRACCPNRPQHLLYLRHRERRRPRQDFPRLPSRRLSRACPPHRPHRRRRPCCLRTRQLRRRLPSRGRKRP